MVEKKGPSVCDAGPLKAEFSSNHAHHSAPAFQPQPNIRRQLSLAQAKAAARTVALWANAELARANGPDECAEIKRKAHQDFRFELERRAAALNHGVAR
jgi:hypothetical protein